MLDCLTCCISFVDSNIESMDQMLGGKHLLNVLHKVAKTQKFIVLQVRKPRHVAFGNQQRVPWVDGELVFHGEEQSILGENERLPNSRNEQNRHPATARFPVRRV